MSKNTLEEKMQHAFDPLHADYEIFTVLTTPLPCSRCRVLTKWAHLERQDRQSMQFIMNAYCEQHGLPQRSTYLGEWREGMDRPTLAPLEEEEQHASITRFVLWVYGGQGTVTAIAECEPDMAQPEFHIWQREDFATQLDYDWWVGMERHPSWAVIYQAHEDATPRNLFVIWDQEYSQFHLIDKEKGTCIPPQHGFAEEESEQQ